MPWAMPYIIEWMDIRNHWSHNRCWFRFKLISHICCYRPGITSHKCQRRGMCLNVGNYDKDMPEICGTNCNGVKPRITYRLRIFPKRSCDQKGDCTIYWPLLNQSDSIETMESKEKPCWNRSRDRKGTIRDIGTETDNSASISRPIKSK